MSKLINIKYRLENRFEVATTKKLTAFRKGDPVNKSALIQDNMGWPFLAAAKQPFTFFTGDRDGDTESWSVDLGVLFFGYNSPRQIPVEVICCNLSCVGDHACSREVSAHL